MLAAGFLFGCMGVFVKLGAHYFTNVELVFYRSLLGLVMVYFFIRPRGGTPGSHHWQLHLLRGLSGSIALLMFFYCITLLPLASAVTLNYTSPLFLTVLTTLVFKERFHLPLTLAIALGFCGVALLLHPTMNADLLLPGLLGLGSGFLASVAYLSVKQLGSKGEPGWRVVFHFTLIGTLLAGCVMLFGTVHPVTRHNLPILLGLGISATLAQMALTRAYRTGKTLVVGSLSYSTIAFASLFGMLLWHEMPPASGWFGMLLIVASGVLSLKLAPRHEGIQTRPERAE